MAPSFTLVFIASRESFCHAKNSQNLELIVFSVKLGPPIHYLQPSPLNPTKSRNVFKIGEPIMNNVLPGFTLLSLSAAM